MVLLRTGKARDATLWPGVADSTALLPRADAVGILLARGVRDVVRVALLALGVPLVLPPARVAVRTAGGAIVSIATTLMLGLRTSTATAVSALALALAIAVAPVAAGRLAGRRTEVRCPWRPALRVPLVLRLARVVAFATRDALPTLAAALLQGTSAVWFTLGVPSIVHEAAVPLFAAGRSSPALAPALPHRLGARHRRRGHGLRSSVQSIG
mmetsp:Transcript_42566/g.132396  ORF Transcript_42566/g.132396 Transcript_42566/m.132396 type:complete len:212 (-) Transcript_42566:600-1235(-)